MLFTDYIFYFFLLITLLINFITPPKYRWVSLLTFNLIFLYFVNYELVLIFLAVATLNFYGFTWIKKDKAFKIVFVLMNLSVLLVFKYLKYFAPSNDFIANIVLPIGISYFIFEQLSFVLDSYKVEKCDYHIGHYLSSSLFLGKITSGPIERPLLFTNNFVLIRDISAKEFRIAGMLIYWGLFKKFVIADNIDKVGLNAIEQGNYTGIALFGAILISKYEIWANFSGYTDIARGIGRFYGLDLTENFKRPFNSVTIREYWTKWHISLSQWIRDYVFYPLASTPISKMGVYFLILVTFLVFGLWHDLNMKYVVYAFIQAFLIFFSIKITPTIEAKIATIKSQSVKSTIQFLRKIYLFIFLVSLPSVFFIARDVKHAFVIFEHLFLESFMKLDKYLDSFMISIGWTIAFVILVEYIESLRNKVDLPEKLLKMNYFLEVAFYFACILLYLNFAHMGSSIEFIYKNY